MKMTREETMSEKQKQGKTNQTERTVEEVERERIAQEELIKKKVDAAGNIWNKVYWGGGSHFKNWLEQSKELAEAMDTELEIEEIDSTGLQCYAEGGEKLYRIWMKETKTTD